MEELQFTNLESENCESGKVAVWDEHGIRYILTTPSWKISDEEKEGGIIPLRPLAEGGQGVTYLTENPRVIIKFAKYNGRLIKDEEGLREYRRQIGYVATLPVPSSCNITLPETLLREYAGYRMTFLGNMRSFSDTFIEFEQQGERPTWLPEGKGYNKIWRYVRSGGLKRRLEAMGRLAAELAKLHAHGIAYCDLSYNNVFISDDSRENVVFLIDPDNLVENGDERAMNIGTPPFRAPEICLGEGCTIFSDTFTFAMLAFDLLCNHHPFQGKAFKAHPGFLEEKEDVTPFAWICDPSDDSNSQELLCPVENLLSKELLMLFWQTFTIGKEDPAERPYLGLWPERFFKEHDNLHICPDCGMGAVPTDRSQCPLCRTAWQDELYFQVFDKDEKELLWELRCPVDQKTLVIPERALESFHLDSFDRTVLTVTLRKGKLYFQVDSSAAGKIDFLFGSSSSEQKNATYVIDQNDCGQLAVSYAGKNRRKIRCQVIRNNGSRSTDKL